MAKINTDLPPPRPEAPRIITPGGMRPPTRDGAVQMTRGQADMPPQGLEESARQMQVVMSLLQRHEQAFADMNDQLQSSDWAHRMLFADVQAALSADDADTREVILELMDGEKWTTRVLEAQAMTRERRNLVSDLSSSDPDLQRFVTSIQEWNDDPRRPPIHAVCFDRTYLLKILASQSTVSWKRREAFMRQIHITDDGIDLVRETWQKREE